MRFTSSLASLVAVVVSLSSTRASPITPADLETLKLQFQGRHLPRNGTSINLVQKDLARIAQLKAGGFSRAQNQKDKRAAGPFSFPLTNDEVSYTVSVGIGTPPTTYTLLVDTGSSNTWIGAGKKYVKTSSGVNTGHAVTVTYGSGSFTGTEYTDTVTFSTGFAITAQSIGVARTSSTFDGIDGILGLGPDDLTTGTVSGVANVPTVVDTLYAEGLISTKIIGILFAPTTTQSVTNGELTFGGTDSTKYTGTLPYFSVTTKSPASNYWGIDASLTYGSTSQSGTIAGITDTGTSLVYLASDVFSKYQTATGGKPDSTTGLLKISSAQYSALQSLSVIIGTNTYPLAPNAQIWPRSLNADIGGTAGSIYLVIANIGSPSGEGLDFILGYAFLERYYSAYDSNKWPGRIAFASTAYTTATTN